MSTWRFVFFSAKCCNWREPGPKSREPGEIFGSWKSESSFSWLVSLEEFEYPPGHPVHPSKSNEQENTKARSANYTDVIVPETWIIQNNILNIFNDFINSLLCRMHPKLTYNQLDGILCRQFRWIQELHPELKICCKNGFEILRFSPAWDHWQRLQNQLYKFQLRQCLPPFKWKIQYKVIPTSLKKIYSQWTWSQ